MRRRGLGLGLGLAFGLWLLGGTFGPALAQNTGLYWQCKDQDASGPAGYCPVSNTYPLPIAGSFTANLGSFTPAGSYEALSVTTTSANVALPSGTTVIVYNTGSQTAYVRMGLTSGVAATTSDDVVPSGGWLALGVGTNGFLAGITGTGSTSLTISGGSGLPAGTGGAGGGGSGGNVNLTEIGGTAVTNPLSVNAIQSGSWGMNATQAGSWTVSATQSGTWNVGNISGTISLPTGASTAANQTSGAQETQVVDGSGNVVGSTGNALNINGPVNLAAGSVASGAMVDGASVTQGAKADTVCASATGTCSLVALQKFTNAQLASLVSLTPVNISSIGGNAITTTLPVSGSVTATISGTPNVAVTNTPTVNAVQSGTWNVGVTGTTAVSGTVTSSPTTTATYTDRSGAVTTGGTSQQLMASNGSRKCFAIRNPATAASQGISAPEPVYLNWGTSAVVAGGTSWELLPGESLSCTDFGLSSTQQINWTAATTGHVLIAKEM